MFRQLNPKRFIVFPGFLLVHFVSFAQGTIIVNGGTMKMINGAYVITRDVSLTSASTLNVNNSTIKIADSINNNSGNFDVTSGTVEMNGTSPQTIPVNAFHTNKIKNLVISNNVTLLGHDSITNVLSFGSSNMEFATSDSLTLKSTAVNTARFADITNAGATPGNTITGKVKVERYVQPERAWRLLTAPISATGAQTINAAWQEGQTSGNALPGFGTQITGGSTANGFDQGVNLNASLKIFTAQAWVGVANTNATPITSQAGYMLFVRGGRDVILSQGVYAATTKTVVRSTGQLKINDQTFTLPISAGFTVIGNPYASPIDFHLLTKNNIQDNFYLWDPKITGTGGVGGFVNLLWDGSSYDVTPTSPSGLNQFIQSGSAFLVKTTDGTTAGALIVKETDKSATQSINVNRGAITSAKFRTNLYSINADSSISIVDGILNSYGTMYSNSIDKYDALNLENFSEDLSSVRDGKSLVVERRQPVGEADTIFLNMLQMKVKYYRFQFTADNFSNTGLTGTLEDSYTNIKTPIDLQGATTVDFNVINIPGSWNPGRFRIVFKQASVLPLTFSSAKAFEQNSNIKVEWQVQNETNINKYDVEKSGDDLQFVKANTVKAKGNSNEANYGWLDENAVTGNNYYRIKSTGINGEIKYSAVMKVTMSKDKPGIVLTTNIITNNTIIFQMNNMPKGGYAVSIHNNLGQLIYAEKIEYNGGTSTEKIQLANYFADGIYHLTIIKPDFTSLTMKLFMQ